MIILFLSGGDFASFDVVPKKPRRKCNLFLKLTKVFGNIGRSRTAGYQELPEEGENPVRSKTETSEHGMFNLVSLIIH